MGKGDGVTPRVREILFFLGPENRPPPDGHQREDGKNRNSYVLNYSKRYTVSPSMWHMRDREGESLPPTLSLPDELVFEPLPTSVNECYFGKLKDRSIGGFMGSPFLLFGVITCKGMISLISTFSKGLIYLFHPLLSCIYSSRGIPRLQTFPRKSKPLTRRRRLLDKKRQAGWPGSY